MSMEKTPLSDGGSVESGLEKVYLTEGNPSIRYTFDPETNQWKVTRPVC